ncbi:MAG: pyridoxamine 5'-phosphate oxidase [Chromatiales bacterium]|nr:pyridoxamine 5'-phosphate oxidase [Chromatiales bacterium]
MTTPTDLANLRRDYRTRPLERSDLAADPVTQFQQWFTEALDANVLDPNAMGVATVGPDGQPSLRMVLLKHFDAQGFVFYTNHDSRKAREMAGNHRVALLLYWAEISRQVRITGTATRVPAAESLRYFLSRPRDSQIGAWVSEQSRVIEGRQLLEAKFAEIKGRFAAGDVPLPSFWGGYRVAMDTVEFWQARENRLHDRFLYSREGAGWTIERLAP